MRKTVVSSILILFFITLINSSIFPMSYIRAVATINDPDGYTNVRNGPGKEYKVISKVYVGEYFLVLRFEYPEWWLVQAPDGKIGCMHVSRIVLPKPYEIAKYYARINDPDGYTNVRKGPGKDYKVISKVYEGEVFIVLEENSNKDWAYILTMNGTRGYMHTSRIKPVPFYTK